jgi:hypothetical protein
MTERRAAFILRYLGAASLLAVGIDHIEQYYVDYYRAVPTIGTLFLLNFVSALLVALGLIAPVRRIAGRVADRLLTILAIGGIGIAGGTLAGLLVSENVGLFGFMEHGYRGAIALSIGFDVAAVLTLGAFVVLRAVSARRRESPSRPQYPHRGPRHRFTPAARLRPSIDDHHSIRTARPRKETS